MLRPDLSLARWYKNSRLASHLAQRSETLWGAAICFVGFLTFFLGVGNFYAGSVLYNELVKPPCHPNATTADVRNSTEFANCSHHVGVGTQWKGDCQRENISGSSECGGFGQSRGVTAWVNSVQLASVNLISPFTGVVVDRFGSRVVAFLGGLTIIASVLSASLAQSLPVFIFLYGVGTGCGVGLMYSPAIIIIAKYFEKRHSVANGIVMSGAGVGILSLGPLSHTIINLFGWRGYLRIYGAMVVCLTLLTLLYKPYSDFQKSKSQNDINSNVKSIKMLLANERTRNEDFDNGSREADDLHTKKKTKKKLVDWTIWKNVPFIVFVGSTNLVALGFSVPMIHLVRFARDLNISSSDASLLVTYQGIGAVLGRLSFGLFATIKCLKPTILYYIGIIMTGVPMLIAAQIRTYAELSVYIVLYGYFFGAQVTLQAVVLRQLVGNDKLAQALGWNMGLMAPVVVIGGPIAGFLHDSTGSYMWGFYFGGISIILAVIVMSFLPCALRYDARKNSNHQLIVSIEEPEANTETELALESTNLTDEEDKLLEENTEL